MPDLNIAPDVGGGKGETSLREGFVAYGNTRVVECPRCHQTCGWCGDYRWHHGQMKLPGTRRRCTLKEVEPEGDNCPLCHGTRKVQRIIAYKVENPS